MDKQRKFQLKGLIIEWKDSNMEGDLSCIQLMSVSHTNTILRFKAKEIFTNNLHVMKTQPMNWLVNVEIIFKGTGENIMEKQHVEMEVTNHTLEEVNEFVGDNVLEEIAKDKDNFLTTYWRLQGL